MSYRPASPPHAAPRGAPARSLETLDSRAKWALAFTLDPVERGLVRVNLPKLDVSVTSPTDLKHAAEAHAAAFRHAAAVSGTRQFSVIVDGSSCGERHLNAAAFVVAMVRSTEVKEVAHSLRRLTIENPNHATKALLSVARFAGVADDVVSKIELK